MSFQYRGLKAVKKRHVVTEEEVKQQMEHLAATRPRRTPVTGRPAQKGDEVILDYAGFCGGVQFEGGTAEAQPLVLGSGTFIPGFEEQLEGRNIGEKVSVKVKFPEQYHAENLAGKPAEFRCVIREIHSMGHYKMDDVFAKEVGQCGTLDEMRERMGCSMQFYADQETEMDLQDSLLRQAAATLDMNITDGQLKDAVDRQMNAVKEQLAQQGVTLEMYCRHMETTEEDMRKKAAPAARQSLLNAAAIDKIVGLEKLEASDEEIKAAREQICRSNNITLDVLDAMKDPELDEMIVRSVLTGKAMGLIRENAEVTEE